VAAVTFEDVAVALGRPLSEPDEIRQVEHWLTGVELAISQRLGDVSLLDQAALTYVEAEAVAALVRNSGTPESSITVSVDDGSVTRRFDSSDYDEVITDAWWTLLGAKPPKAVSMSVTSGYLLR
jgi:hypothetical protein